ncbi:unnamed protein product [Oppiella nova]|uniref:Uncharacterized protein n=1 Tax=Oppiella nova TaxID=334625 RepID=A0A7R9QWY3_9ACAR|nr:unnamed protein product [Oppiella nova]CAG2177437.1 unnamed protein product [Oppiella nova]
MNNVQLNIFEKSILNIQILSLIIFIIITNLIGINLTNYEFIIDKNTGAKLALKTNIYYIIQNTKSDRFLLWFGPNSTLPGDLVSEKAKTYHVFNNLNNGWYRMNHYFGSHNVKIAQAHNEGYYFIYNQPCYIQNNDGDYPNGEINEYGSISCVTSEMNRDYQEYKWEFTEKPGQISTTTTTTTITTITTTCLNHQ